MIFVDEVVDNQPSRVDGSHRVVVLTDVCVLELHADRSHRHKVPVVKSDLKWFHVIKEHWIGDHLVCDWVTVLEVHWILEEGVAGDIVPVGSRDSPLEVEIRILEISRFRRIGP